MLKARPVDPASIPGRTSEDTNVIRAFLASPDAAWEIDGIDLGTVDGIKRVHKFRSKLYGANDLAKLVVRGSRVFLVKR